MNELTAMARAWYRQAKQRDAEALLLSEDCLGAERDAFLRGMAISRTLIDEVIKIGAIEEPVLKAKVGVADRMFLILWSAWNDALTGRYGQAAERWRSLFELPRFLLAFSWNPNLAERWSEDGRVKIKDARRAIRDTLKGDGLSQVAKEWDQRHMVDERAVQDFSHVNFRSTYSILGISVDPDGQPQSYRLRAELSPHRTREFCVFLAKDSWELARACSEAFREYPAVSTLWDSQGRQALDLDIDILRQALAEVERSAPTKQAAGEKS